MLEPAAPLYLWQNYSSGSQNHLFTSNMVTRITKNIITTWRPDSTNQNDREDDEKHQLGGTNNHHKSPKEKYQKYQQKIHQEKSYQKKSTSHPISPTSLCTLLLQHDPQCKKRHSLRLIKMKSSWWCLKASFHLLQTYTLPFGGGPKLIRAAYFIQIGTNQPTIALVMPTNTDTGQNYILYCYLETSRLDNKWSHLVLSSNLL